jgi:hypothetical protein
VYNIDEMLAIQDGSLGRRAPKGNQAQRQRHGMKKVQGDFV